MARGFADRIGAAIATPRQALEDANNSKGPGRAPSDVAVLFLLGVVALHLPEMATAGWLAVDGEPFAALQSTVAILARDLSTPIMILFASAVALTVAAGQRRSPGVDFDLACVAFVPAVVVHVAAAAVLSLVPRLAGSGFDIVVSVVAYGWFAVGLWLAHRQTRARGQAQ